jgi:hypothetical protein
MNSEWEKPLADFLAMCVDHGSDRRCDSNASTPEIVERLRQEIAFLAKSDNQGPFHYFLNPRRAVYYDINLLINRGENATVKNLIDEILNERH